MAKMKAPEGATSASHEGITYKVKKGVITVPHEAVPALQSHGYETIGETDEEDEEVENALAKKRAEEAKKVTGEEGGEKSEESNESEGSSGDEKAALVAEAKLLKIKSPHLYGVDKLKELIEEAKKVTE